MSDRPPLPEIPTDADERSTLMAFLTYYRADLLDRCWGLTDEQLRQPLAPSTLTLGRLIAHMALVEYEWFRVRFSGDDMPEPWRSLDFDADRDAEMTMADTATGADLTAGYQTSIADSDSIIAATASLDATSQEERDGARWNMRWILVHMVEEYARHCGHADLIRESIDGDLAN